MANIQRGKASAPWWRFGYMWLVLGGPALVVLASFITLWLAIRWPDPQVTMDATRNAQPLSEGKGQAQALAPAVKARNHAATGVQQARP